MTHTQTHTAGRTPLYEGRPIAETPVWQHNTHDRHKCPRRVSNPQSQ